MLKGISSEKIRPQTLKFILFRIGIGGMLKLSAVIITRNEAANIRRCLESLNWVDEIVILDSGSTDNTLKICAEYKCRIFQTEWLGFGKTKQKAVDLAVNDWVLSIDADEEVSLPLQNTIKSLLINPQCHGYRVNRRSFYLGRQIRYSGWNRDYPLRLFHRGSGRFNNRIIHESVVISGTIGTISEILWHHTYPNLDTHLRKINEYSLLGARQMAEEGRTSSPFAACLRGWLKFCKMYLLQFGFLDGKTGFILAINSAYGVYLKYLRLWLIRK